MPLEPVMQFFKDQSHERRPLLSGALEQVQRLIMFATTPMGLDAGDAGQVPGDNPES